MKTISLSNSEDYHDAMGRLLVLYSQVDHLIMEICAERIATAPDEDARLGLAKQVGDESRHVAIQRKWMSVFGTKENLIISDEQAEIIRQHFRELLWVDFLVEMYLCVEALGSEAVEKIVPLADPGTRESFRIPLTDELDHIAFGLSSLQKQLRKMTPRDQLVFFQHIPERIEHVTELFHSLVKNIPELFTEVGANYEFVCHAVLERRDEVIDRVISQNAA